MILDPRLSPQQLQTLASQRPDLHQAIAQHPNCPPQLAAWIQQITPMPPYNAQATHHTQPQVPPHAQPALPHAQQVPQTTPNQAPFGTSTHQATYPPTYTQPTFNQQVPPQPSRPAANQKPHSKRKKNNKSQIQKALIAASVVVVLVITGILGWAFLGASPSYAYGVEVTNTHTVPENGAILASAANADETHSLIITDNADDLVKVISTKHNQAESTVLSAKPNQPIEEVLSNPMNALCGAVECLSYPVSQNSSGKVAASSDNGSKNPVDSDNRSKNTGKKEADDNSAGYRDSGSKSDDSKDSDTDSKDKDSDTNTSNDKDSDTASNNEGPTITINNRTFVWDEESGTWNDGDTSFEAHILIGDVDGYIIGSNAVPEAAGQTNTGTIVVDSITAYDAQSGEAIWTKELEQPGIVTISDNVITVVEVSDQDSRKKLEKFVQQNTADSNTSDAIDPDEVDELINDLVQGAKDANIYELAPAKKGEGDVSKGGKSALPGIGPRTDAIRDFDFGNATYPPIDTVVAWEGRPITLKDGVWFVSWEEAQEMGVNEKEFVPDSLGVSIPEYDKIGDEQAIYDAILFGDLNGDGYEDALVPLRTSQAFMQGKWWGVYYLPILWEPETQTAIMNDRYILTEGRCDNFWSDISIEDDGTIVAIGKFMRDTDTCAGGPTKPGSKTARYDKDTDSFIED